MAMIRIPHDLPALGVLAADAVLGMTGLVEDLHGRIAGVSADSPAWRIAGITYGSIRGVTQVIRSISEVIAQAAQAPEQGAADPEREAMLAGLNGVIGDYLAATHNPLAIGMSLRQNGQPLPLEPAALARAVSDPRRKLLIFVHGLCMNDLQWSHQGNNPAEGLARELGYTPIYLLYNSGLHISTNGRMFARQLETLVKAWPIPVDELVILTHSMGGLVTRSAFQIAEAGMGWPGLLRTMVFLGVPHHGSPLERGGSRLQAVFGIHPYTAPFARLGRIRSAGITDMRYGSLLDEDWQGRDRFARSHERPQRLPLPAGVKCYAIGAVTSSNTDHPLSNLIGDRLVPLDSALGKHADPRRNLDFPEANCWVGYRMGHLDLLRNPDVYTQIRRWLESPSTP